MKIYTAIFIRPTQDNKPESFGIEMHLRRSDAIKESKQQAKINNWRFIELRENI